MSSSSETPSWADVKNNIQQANIINSFREGDVWWTAVGENIGIEINGKNSRYSRPVVIVKKFSELGFLGVPLTSVPHDGTWYVKFEFQGREEYACLSQAKTMSVKRLYNKIGSLPGTDLDAVRTALINLISTGPSKQ